MLSSWSHAFIYEGTAPLVTRSRPMPHQGQHPGTVRGRDTCGEFARRRRARESPPSETPPAYIMM